MLFQDRRDAGRQLADRLAFLRNERSVVVLGIPRGGVVVASEIAEALAAPLDSFMSHKIGAPLNPELAIGAMTSTGALLLDEDVICALGLTQAQIEWQVERERGEMARRLALFRKDRPPLDLKNKSVVLVDDGVATGSTVLAALHALRNEETVRLILAVPVGPLDTVNRLAQFCSGVVVIGTPEPFWAVGRFYRNFGQTSDQEVNELLARAMQRSERPGETS